MRSRLPKDLPTTPLAEGTLVYTEGEILIVRYCPTCGFQHFLPWRKERARTVCRSPVCKARV